MKDKIQKVKVGAERGSFFIWLCNRTAIELTLAVLDGLFEEAKKDFPDIKREDALLRGPGSKSGREKGTGISFYVPKGTVIPKDYKSDPWFLDEDN